MKQKYLLGNTLALVGCGNGCVFFDELGVWDAYETSHVRSDDQRGVRIFDKHKIHVTKEKSLRTWVVQIMDQG